MGYIETLSQGAKRASVQLRTLDEKSKNALLTNIADALNDYKTRIFEANAEDIERARVNGTKEAMIERLAINEKVFKSILTGIEDTIKLKDPIGNVDKMWVNENGLQIGVKRVPLGVIGIIYESRPNVTVDAAVLCLKTGNAVILKGGSDALGTNRVLIEAIKDGLRRSNLPVEAVQFIDTTDREATKLLLLQTEYVDCVIPRGGAGLIQFVLENARVPVIETGTGNCHIYVDKGYDVQNAIDIILNAKMQKPGACNAVETILVHTDEMAALAAPLVKALAENDVKMHACPAFAKVLDETALAYSPATEKDYFTEYLDYELALKCVDSMTDAIDHIEQYSTHHSESILTDDYSNATTFLNKVDSAAVYVNASTRFTDGSVFGFGAEIGISTQKLHARGPMGLEALTTIKYIVYGQGQIRP
ncbi:glutamate-5-semialdehyde dehydrogenase [Fusibacter paucivorans]|uniref:Gamma-glutamyl phosphate reductase n=1 Tax=Fusibacter paucivorans TaxID=76009 RepID=A0ABS5PSL3_9FIRM|nr:glutamate-5-semialdehyde dehydrogenase [Fusibacter paucivorans]MBS7528160.1 glutamate-5-semialdehyde dehydrogenase [Fusibacter paucivorans]